MTLGGFEGGAEGAGQGQKERKKGKGKLLLTFDFLVKLWQRIFSTTEIFLFLEYFRRTARDVKPIIKSELNECCIFRHIFMRHRFNCFI